MPKQDKEGGTFPPSRGNKRETRFWGVRYISKRIFRQGVSIYYEFLKKYDIIVTYNFL